MERLSREALEGALDAFDADVARTRDIDAFCSSSAWVIPAERALAPAREIHGWRSDAGWALLARRVHSEGWPCLTPLEASWCLASPFACPDASRAAELARDVARELAIAAKAEVLLLSGLAPGSAMQRALVAALAPGYEILGDVLPNATRFQASLEGGVDGFLSRRSPHFRARLRQAARRTARAGVVFEPARTETVADALALHERMVAVEARSWKGLAGEGLVVPSFAAFYRMMLPMLARRGALRAQVGRRDGEDVAIIVGGLIDTPDGVVYRGLQFSFDDRLRAHAPGNAAQLAQITALADEGVALYDLGSDVDYKRRWGERTLSTLTLVAVPRAP